MEEIILNVKKLRKEYYINKGLFKKAKIIKAVNGIDFKLKRGEILSIVGESGCGKSTTAKLLMGIEKATSGEIYFEGKNLTHFNRHDWKEYRKKVQIIFQDPYSSLNPRWNVGKIIAEPLILNSNLKETEIQKKVYEIMDKVGLLPEWFERYPHQFSGGQRQRIGIARALILHPEVLVCDEPVSALDVSIQAQVLNLLLDLQEELNLTYIFISHDLGVVEHISDRIIVMYFGDIVEENSTDGLLSGPTHEYTKKLLNAIPHVENHFPSK